MGQKYAKLIAAAVIDLKNNNLLIEGSHIRIIELGSGHGRLSENVIRYLKAFLPIFQDIKVSFYITDQSALSVEHIQERLKDFKYTPKFEVLYHVLDINQIDEYLKKLNPTSDDMTILLGNYFIDSLPKDYFRKNGKETEIFVLEDAFLKDETTFDQKKLCQWINQTGSWKIIQDQSFSNIKAINLLNDFESSDVFQYCAGFDRILSNFGKVSGQKMFIMSDVFQKSTTVPMISYCGGYFSALSLKSLNHNAKNINFHSVRANSDKFHSAFETQVFWQGEELKNLPILLERFNLDFSDRNHFEFGNAAWTMNYLVKDDLDERVKKNLLPKMVDSSSLIPSDLKFTEITAPAHNSGIEISRIRAQQCKVIIKEIAMLGAIQQEKSKNKIKLKFEINQSIQDPNLAEALKINLNDMTSLPNVLIKNTKKIVVKNSKSFDVSESNKNITIAIVGQEYLSSWALKVLNNMPAPSIVIQPYYFQKEEKKSFEEFKAKFDEHLICIIFGDWILWMPKNYFLSSSLELFLTKLDVDCVSLNVLFSVFFASFYQKSEAEHKHLKNIYKNFCSSFGLTCMKSEELKDFSLTIGRLLGVNRREYQEAIMAVYGMDENDFIHQL
ncbi:MAG: SAM-dependent methyltransferase [Pseudomonadota bacterium]